MSDEYVDRIVRELNRHRITAFRFEHRSKHRVVIVSYMGKIHKIFFPASGSDAYRGPLNVVRDVRRELGLVLPSNAKAHPKPKKQKAPHARRARALKVSSPEMPTAIKDKFFAPLAALKAQFAAAGSDQPSFAPA